MSDGEDPYEAAASKSTARMNGIWAVVMFLCGLVFAVTGGTAVLGGAQSGAEDWFRLALGVAMLVVSIPIWRRRGGT